ncbi:hypothetical protein [Humibacter sp.]|uniref:hypothetical protein n=1 Tax=Humibacter sp. TaxID=1940291 RepID=UPI002BB90762|nr:hypothetical protein [Humibacter sp.]HVX09195.1 hypothetical protein [Humibacter sp.]
MSGRSAEGDRVDVALTVHELLSLVNHLERAKRRGSDTARRSAEDLQSELLRGLRSLRDDVGLNARALHWYVGEAPPFTYKASAEQNSWGEAPAQPRQSRAPSVPRLMCCFCGESTETDDGPNVVHIEVESVDGSYVFGVGAHVWCLPEEIGRERPDAMAPTTAV